MPFVVVQDADRCPAGKPWAVKREGTDRTFGCHPTKDAATQQQKALYANEVKAEGETRPPNLRDANEANLQADECCRTCSMFRGEPNTGSGECTGYANYLVQIDEVCDSYDRDPEAKAEDPNMAVTTPQIEDVDALREAIPAVGDSIELAFMRRFLIDRATELDCLELIPEDWREPRDEVQHQIELRQAIAWRKARAPKRGELERRSLPAADMELRDAGLMIREEDGQTRQLLEFVGHASVFGQDYRVGRYTETIDAGAFKRSLANPHLDTVLRTEHTDLPLARTTGRITLADGSQTPTLHLAEDEEGLHVRALLDPTDPDVQRLVPKYRRGDLKEMSFAFRCHEDEWNEDMTERHVRAADIHRGDVSIVTYGASPTTMSTMRSEETIGQLREGGQQGVADMMVEYAKYFALPAEKRLGAVFSSDSMMTLSHILTLASDADDAVDEIQEVLADLLGVPNPDDDDDDDSQENAQGEDEYWLRGQDDIPVEDRVDLSDKGRQAMAKAGTARPDGSYPIPNVAYLKKAIRAFGRAGNPSAVKAWIIKRAKALGATSLLPDSWGVGKQSNAAAEDVELRVPVIDDDAEELRLELAALDARSRA